jgi:hypothetical protein
MSSKLVLKPLWNNGSCTYAANFKRMSSEDRRDVEELADEAGYTRLDDIWTPPSGVGAVSGLFEKMRQAGFELEFDDPDNAPFDLQRLSLTEVSSAKWSKWSVAPLSCSEISSKVATLSELS